MMSLRYTGEATMDATALRDVERDVERWKDKVEVRLDNRQVFFLFFGSAMVACMLFVLGVIVGKRLESRGRAQAPVIEDPLAALDRFGVEGAGSAASPNALTFPRALLAASSPTTSRPEHAGRAAGKTASSATGATMLTSTAGTGEVAVPPPVPSLNKKLAALPHAVGGQKLPAPVSAPSAAAKLASAAPSPREATVSPPVVKAAAPAPSTKAPAAAPATVKVAARAPGAKIAGVSPSSVKVAVTGTPAKAPPSTSPGPKATAPVISAPRSITESDPPVKVVALDPFRPTAPSPARSAPASSSDGVAKGGGATAPAPAKKGGFMLQLSSFQDRAEADAFARRFAAQNAYVSSTEVPGKGTVYRVRVGSYSTMKEAANAKISFEHDHNVIAYVAGSGPAN
jgi:DedD protein